MAEINFPRGGKSTFLPSEVQQGKRKVDDEGLFKVRIRSISA